MRLDDVAHQRQSDPAAPASLRVAPPHAKIFACSSGAIPRPRSLTAMTSRPSAIRASIVNARSSPEYLMALSIRFASAWPTASASIVTSGRSAATLTSTLKPC